CVWKGRFVSDATVSSCVKSVRKALGDSGQSQTYLRTIRGRGFQFAAPVTCLPAGMETPSLAPDRTPAEREPPPLPEETTPPKIAVLPLFPLTPDPQLGLLGDALAQE